MHQMVGPLPGPCRCGSSSAPSCPFFFIHYMNERYQAMLEQLQSLGLNPNSFVASVKDLQNENFMLKEACKKEHSEKEDLHE